MMRSFAVCIALFVTAGLAAPSVQAQRSASERAAHEQLMSELARLRQAAAYEARGDYAEAEKIVGEVLAANPTSLSGLLTMERVLTAQGRTAEIMPAVDRLLAADPTSVIGHQTRLRVLSDLDEVERLSTAIEQWVRATPALETPYREAAAVLRSRGEPQRAVELLERGRRQIDRPDALALELGDAFVAMNDPEAAAREWSRAIGETGRGLMLVERRLEMLPDGGMRVIPPLVTHLSGEPMTDARQRAAAMLAIEAGLEADAVRAMRQLMPAASDVERQALFVELARRADAADLYTVALAAYTELLASAPDTRATLAIRSRIAELAMLTGDTARAASMYGELESAAAAGSPQRRQAVAVRIQLTARDGDLETAIADYGAFRSEFAAAPELDATAATLGTLLLEANRVEDARRVLEGVTGADAARLRGRLYLRMGDIDRARHEMISAAPLLRGREATSTIALAALLTRVSARGGELVAQVVGAPEAELPAHIREAAASAGSLPVRERAAILDFLADAADAAGLVEDAAALRREIVEELPRTQEAPSALLTLARQAGSAPGSEEEARLLLERLIVEYPRSALAPQARAELQRLQPR